jgi:hypothetical protein
MSVWSDILNEVLSKVDYKRSRGVWYRGHANSEWKLNSSIYRISKNQNRVFTYEKNIYNDFLNLGSEFCDFNENKGWNTLFLMQHYGMDTRLLDWTGSFLTALYFANMGRKNDLGEVKEGCIWILNPFKMNESTHKRNSFFSLDLLPDDLKVYEDIFTNKNDNIKSIAIVPRRNNNRIKMQDGYFTIQGTKNIPLEEELNQTDALEKIILPPETYEESMNYLRLNGMNYYSLFGGVDGLCIHIKNEIFKSFTYENI